MTSLPATLERFPCRTFDKLRFADTDRQGHVNNAVFATLLETGRVEILYNPARPLTEPGCAFVIASLHLDFRGEIIWPGQIDIGTAVIHVGNCSLQLEQGLFQGDRCVATAQTTIVQMNESSRRAHPLGPSAREYLATLLPHQ